MQKKTALQNAIIPELIPTYEGTNQSTHPSVLFFYEGWNGWRYWMAMTPYPFNNDGFEDPSILVSNDGRKWEAPKGVTNPLTPKPEPGHNCDTDLVYVAEEDELRIYYVEADDVKQSWVKLMRSKDGVHWTKPEIVLHDPDFMYGILSPTIERMEDGSYKMWYVDTGNTGYQNQCNRVLTRVSADGLSWSATAEPETGLAQPGYQIWHLDIQRDSKTGILHAFYPAYPDGGNCDGCLLFYALRRPGENWTVFTEPVLERGTEDAFDDFCLYRSSFLLDSGADNMKLWYGAKRKRDASWNMGYIEDRYSAFCGRLTPRT